jgi:hypothetical protein
MEPAISPITQLSCVFEKQKETKLMQFHKETLELEYLSNNFPLVGHKR